MDFMHNHHTIIGSGTTALFTAMLLARGVKNLDLFANADQEIDEMFKGEDLDMAARIWQSCSCAILEGNVTSIDRLSMMYENFAHNQYPNTWALMRKDFEIGIGIKKEMNKTQTGRFPSGFPDPNIN